MVSWLHGWDHSCTGQGTYRLAEGFCILLLQNPVQHTEAALQGVPLPQATAPLAGLLHTAGHMGRLSDMSIATAEAVQAVAGLLYTARQMGSLSDAPSCSFRSCLGSCWRHTAVPGMMALALTRCANSKGVQAVCTCWATAQVCTRSLRHGWSYMLRTAKGCAGSLQVQCILEFA